MSNTPYDGGRWVTDGGWWVTDGHWCVTDGGWWVTDGGWWATDGGWCVTDGGWWVTDGGRWVTDGSWWVTDGHWCVTDGGWWVTDGGWWVTDGGWCVTDGGWWVTDGGWWVTDGGWCVTDGGWWVATKYQRVDAIVKEKKKGERPYGTPCAAPHHLHQDVGFIADAVQVVGLQEQRVLLAPDPRQVVVALQPRGQRHRPRPGQLRGAPRAVAVDDGVLLDAVGRGGVAGDGLGLNGAVLLDDLHHLEGAAPEVVALHEVGDGGVAGVLVHEAALRAVEVVQRHVRLVRDGFAELRLRLRDLRTTMTDGAIAIYCHFGCVSA